MDFLLQRGDKVSDIPREIAKSGEKSNKLAGHFGIANIAEFKLCGTADWQSRSVMDSIEDIQG